MTTAGAAVAAHVAANRYEYIAISYTGTADRLQTIRDKWVDRPADARMSPSDFVHSCEDAISVENQAWMAKLADEPRSPTPNPA